MEKIKLFCVSLGCDKNLVDTEKMLGVAGGLGVSFTDDETEADAILINTCCFIGDAKEESVNTILEMARYKEEGKCRALIVAGCLAQRYKQEIIDEIPEVDAILGTTSYEEIGNVLTRLFGEEKEKKERTVIHLYIKENDTHHYFGSIANVFEYFSPDMLGISYGSLRNYGLANEKTFQNSKCIIRRGTLLSKSGNRGKK